MTTPGLSNHVQLRSIREREHLAPVERRRCLWIVPRGERPPVCGPLEDWVWDDADERDVGRRLRGLVAERPDAGAGPQRLDHVEVEAVDAVVLELLRGWRCIDVATIDAAIASTHEAVALDRHEVIRRLRESLLGTGFEISWTGAGYLLHGVQRERTG